MLKIFSSSKSTMWRPPNLFFYLFLDISVVSIYSIEYESISKVICYFSRFENADIFKGALVGEMKLSKELLRNCDIKIKVLSNVMDFDSSQLISFFHHGSKNKEPLQHFQSHKNYLQ